MALSLGCYAGIDDDGQTAVADPADTGADGGDSLEEFEPEPAVLPRLTGTQYRNALTQLLGDALPPTPVEPDTNPYLFYSIGATTTAVSEIGVQQYEEAADRVTQVVFDNPTRREALLGCAPVSPGDECVQNFLVEFGRRAFRRPLTDEEYDRWLALTIDLAEGDPWQGVRLAVAGMLQSPYFLYRVELGEPDPDDPTRHRYTSFEIASRLSFLLTNSIPDVELLDAAEAGELSTTEGILEQAERLLEKPSSRKAVQNFFAQYLDLGRLDEVERDPVRYPDYSESLPESMRTEVKLLVDDLVYRSDTDVRRIFSTRRTFVNDELAELYGVSAPEATPVAFVPVELPEDGPRAGLLTLGAFLAMNAHETQTSPTLRGKYVRERVLCQTVPPPPDDVDINLDPDNGGEPKTLREMLEQHRTDPACSGCHSFIDPPGMLFEHFDSIGAYRTEDNGYDIDASGELDGTPLNDAGDLATLLADDERVGRCIVQQLYRHANGRLDDAVGERPAIDDLDQRFAAADYRFIDLLLEFVTHESFRYLAPPKEGP